MDLQTRLRKIVEAIPHDGQVTIPVAQIKTWLDVGVESDPDAPATATPTDFTVNDLAARFRRRPNTVRDWIRSGQLEAYLFCGREYRVTPDALERFLAKERLAQVVRRTPATSSHGQSRRGPQLGAWKEVRREAA